MKKLENIKLGKRTMKSMGITTITQQDIDKKDQPSIILCGDDSKVCYDNLFCGNSYRMED